MGLDNALNISISGVYAEREHMEMIASNLANINTTRSIDGGPYRRKVLSYLEVPISFADTLNTAEEKIELSGGGVKTKVALDMKAPLQKVYNPGHPDADENGYLSLPNVSVATEMTDLVYTNSLYSANITVFNATKKMEQEALQIQ